MRADWTAADERRVRERYPDMVPCPPPALHASIELLGRRCTVTDLSHEIAPSNPTFKGHQRTVMWQHLSHEDVQQFGLTEPPYSYEVVAFTLCGHTSTHCDSISHIVPEQGARPIDQSPLQWHMAPGIWLDFRAKEPNSYITRADLERQVAEHGLEIRQGSVLLYATGWSDKWSGDPYAYIAGYPGLDEQASHFLADSGVVAFGGRRAERRLPPRGGGAPRAAGAHDVPRARYPEHGEPGQRAPHPQAQLHLHRPAAEDQERRRLADPGRGDHRGLTGAGTGADRSQ